MKTAFCVGVLNLSIFLVAATSWASNYPADYFYQTVRILHDGPAVFAHVGSGCSAQLVIGYKNDQLLSAAGPESIDAVIVGSCIKDGNMRSQNTYIRLGREWNGQGYLSYPLSPYLYPSGCMDGTLSVAFSVNDQWDSLDGKNYGHFSYGFYHDSRRVLSFPTREGDCSNITLNSWNIIIQQMKE